MIAYTKGATLLRVDHVSLRIGDRLILRDVNAEIADIERPDQVQGQVVCFLGPSGIGKSTLSRIIAGLQQPTAGTVTLEDGRPTAAGRVGMVAQTYPFFTFLTVMENFTLAGRRAGLTRRQADAKAKEFIGTFDLGSYVDLYRDQLSGGTRQRVAIVRQLMCAGQYLVLDEPFSGLDLLMKQRACELITRVADFDTKNTIIVVTHDVTEGMSVADTVWLMGREGSTPGARLVAQYDLAAMGLCWQPDLIHVPFFLEAVSAVKKQFLTL